MPAATAGGSRRLSNMRVILFIFCRTFELSHARSALAVTIGSALTDVHSPFLEASIESGAPLHRHELLYKTRPSVPSGRSTHHQDTGREISLRQSRSNRMSEKEKAVAPLLLLISYE